MEEEKKQGRKNRMDIQKQKQSKFSPDNNDNKQGELPITTTATSRSQGMGQRRRVCRRSIYSYNDSDSKAEVIRSLPRPIQNKLRDRKVVRREREKKFRELRASLAKYIENYKFTRDALIDAIDQNKLSDWKALAILVDSLGQPLGSILTDVYHEVWPSEPFWVYVLKFEAEWENRLYNYL
ncbi:PREDICTED: uncharacterized protein LOC109226215 [Nicotiana attenuata]|uniref:uncharacterized protein LOC109226215 n=1 Tax=Nicotiana attenuata TaxID=49451 RepID=UPI000905C455|nr:PREDICTED: uncharacterized protein LOC109226215 [Nicotiana attenuata]